MTEEVKLKPCPFCGSENAGPLYCDEECCGGKLRWVDCEDCGCAMNAETHSIEKWNHRPLEDDKDARIADLERQLAEAETMRNEMYGLMRKLSDNIGYPLGIKILNTDIVNVELSVFAINTLRIAIKRIGDRMPETKDDDA